jgi:large subunit ribosomal protein L18
MSKELKQKAIRHYKRKLKVRAKISGVAEKPRVTIFKSNRYFYAQAIDDTKGLTLCCADGSKLAVGANKEGVKKVAEVLAAGLKAKSVDSIVFDRSGYMYHGVVASFADALRECGIKF